MVLHSMYVHDNDAERSIGFEVNLQAPTALSHLKFIQYIEVKLDGKRQAISRTVREERHRFGTTSVRFPESTFGAAKAFCDAKLMDNGAPTPEFHHELEHANLSEEVDKDLLWEMQGAPNNPYRMAKA